MIFQLTQIYRDEALRAIMHALFVMRTEHQKGSATRFVTWDIDGGYLGIMHGGITKTLLMGELNIVLDLGSSQGKRF
ncbi:hypothetical protein COP2_008891 [Malus domestica]